MPKPFVPSASRPLRAWLLRYVVERAAEGGVDVPALLATHQLSSEFVNEIGPLVDLGVVEAIANQVALALDAPDLGLELAERVSDDAFELLGYVARAASNVGTAARCLARYASLAGPAGRLSYEERDGVGTLDFRIPGRRTAEGRQDNEMLVALWILRLRAWSGVELVPERVWFAHPRPENIDKHQAIFRTDRILFDAGSIGLALRAEDLSLPLRTHDPGLFGALSRQLEALRIDDQGGVFLTHVRAVVRDQLKSGQPSSERVARLLRVSPRTLRHKLAQQNTTFQEVVDSVREAQALRLVKQPGLSLAEIASALGFSDARSFTRAFKRWTGSTPGRFR